MFKSADTPVPPGRSADLGTAPMPRLKPYTPPQPAGPAAGQPGAVPAPHPLQLPQAQPWGQQAATWLGNKTQQGMNSLVGAVGQPGQLHDWAQHKITEVGTRNTPPITAMGYTKGLGPLQGPVDSALGFAQKFVKNNPQGFAGLVGGLGAPLVKPLLSTPLGMPAMTGLYGLLGGGTPAADAQTYFKPLIDKFT